MTLSKPGSKLAAAACAYRADQLSSKAGAFFLLPCSECQRLSGRRLAFQNWVAARSPHSLWLSGPLVTCQLGAWLQSLNQLLLCYLQAQVLMMKTVHMHQHS